MENYKTIRTYNTSVEANLAKSYLNANGVEALLSDEFAGEIFSTVIKGIKLNVPVDQIEAAEKLISVLPEILSDEEQAEVVEILEECDALLTGHFQLTSGLHSKQYVEKIKIINHPDKVESLCIKLVENLHKYEVDVVIGLAMGGIALGYEVAKQLETKFAFTQRKDGAMTFRQGFDLKPGMKAIIIEDITTTGGSVKEVITLLKSMDISVSAVGLLVDRSGGEIDFGVPTIPLLTMSIKTYKPEECPLCADKIPLTKPGSSDKK